jgi:F-type H+-transporting ATPase subunit delta
MLGQPRLGSAGLASEASLEYFSHVFQGLAARSVVREPNAKIIALRRKFLRGPGESVADEDTIVSGMAGRYALALFSLAQDAHTTGEVAAALKTFDGLIAESADLQRLVRSPVFTADEQIKALGAILARAGIFGVAANFIKLVAAKRRLFAIRDMIAGYQKLYDFERGVTRAEVTVASTPSDAHVAALKEALKDATKGKDVEVSVKIDPSIIGGLVVKLGSRMVDGSLKTKLNAIRTRMKEVG